MGIFGSIVERVRERVSTRLRIRALEERTQKLAAQLDDLQDLFISLERKRDRAKDK